MDPRKGGPPGHHTSVVDEFGNEEPVLEQRADESDVEVVKIVITDRQLASPLDIFPPETAQPRVARAPQTAILDIGEFPLVHARAAPAAPPTRGRTTSPPHRRWKRRVGAVAIATIVTAVAVVAATALKRVNLTAVVDDLTAKLASTPAVLEVPAPGNSSRPTGAAAAVPQSTNETVVGARSVTPAATAPPSNIATQAPPSSPRRASEAAASAARSGAGTTSLPPSSRRAAAVTASAAVAPPKPVAQRRQDLSRPAEQPRAVAPTTSPRQVAEVTASSAGAAVSSAPAVPATNSGLTTAAGTTALAAGNRASATPAPATSVPPPSVPATSVPPTSAAAASALPTSTRATPEPAASVPPTSPPPPARAIPAPAPSAAAASAIATPGLTTETRAVAMTLNRYQQAFSSLDANAAHAVWPSVDVRALAKAFDQLDEQTFELEGCNINVAGARAEADCAGNARYIRKVGNKALRVEPRRWHFRLRQSGEQWLIDGVDAR